MRSRHHWVLGVLAAVALGSSSLALADDSEPTSLALGDPAPMSTVKMKSTDGREVSIADVAGKKGTLVVFSCNGCPWAKAWESRIVTTGNTYTKRGIGVMVVNANDADQHPEEAFAEMQTRAKQRGMKYPYVVDPNSDLARAFGATRTPEAFLFDAGGKLVYHGTIDDNAKEPKKVSQRYLDDALKAVWSGKAVAVSETKALGCGIKFRPKA